MNENKTIRTNKSPTTGDGRIVKLFNNHYNRDFSLLDLKSTLKRSTIKIFGTNTYSRKELTNKNIDLICSFRNEAKVVAETNIGCLVSLPVKYRLKEDKTQFEEIYISFWIPKIQLKNI